MNINFINRNFNIPTIPHLVPEHYDISFQPCALKEPSTKESSDLQEQIGASVVQIQNSGMTTLQKERAIAISFLAISIIVFIAAVTVGVLTGLLPVFMAGSALGLIGIVVAGSLTISFSQECDLDNPKERSEILDQFSHKSLDEIVQSHSWQQIVSYDLFERKLRSLTIEQKQNYYFKFQQLFNAYAYLQGIQQNNEERVNQRFEDNTGPINEALEDFNQYAQSFEPLTDVEIATKNQILNEYQNRIQLWNDWHQQEITNIQNAARKAFNTLSTSFLELGQTENVELDLVSFNMPPLNQNTTAEQYLLLAINSIKKSSLFKGKIIDWNWDNVIDQDTQYYMNFPRLLILALLQSSISPEKFREALLLPELTYADIKRKKGEIQANKSFPLYESASLKILMRKIEKLNSEQVSNLILKLAGKDLETDENLKPIFDEICSMAIPLESYNGFQDKLGHLIS